MHQHPMKQFLWGPVPALAALAIFLFTVSAAWGGDLPLQLQQELEAVLEKKAGDLYQQKNDEGLRFQRGTYSKKFRQTGADSYQVAFAKDTANGGRLKTERYLLTLEKGESGKWKVASEELQDTYEKMIREVPGDEKYFRFDSMTFDEEGMRIHAVNGSMVLDYVDGRPYEILLTGDDLGYSYSPPEDLPYGQSAAYEHLKERHLEDFVFKPELAVIHCDGDTCATFMETLFTGLEEGSEGSLDPALVKYFREEEKEMIDRRQDSVFADFRLPFEDDRELYRVSVKRQGRKQWLSLLYDSEEAWEVSYFATNYGLLYGYISQEARKAGVKPYDVEVRPDSFAKDFEVETLRGTVQVAVDDAELLVADLEYDMNIQREVEEIKFALGSFGGFGGKKISERHPSLIIDSLETGDGHDLTWVLTGPAHGYVIFPEPVPAGTKLKIHMAYQNRGSIIKFSPSYSYMDRGGWLPFVRFSDRIEEFEMTVKAPSRYTVLGCGTKQSEETEGEVTTTHWKARSPVAFPTIIFGDYYKVEPKIKATRIDGTEIPVAVYADKDGMAQRGIRGKQLVPIAEQAVNSLNLYREIYGMDYPYGKLDLVSDPLGALGALYGQAPSSLIFLGWGVFRGEGEMVDKTGVGGIGKFLREVVSHEVGHEWWGHIISHANNRNYWFIETFTEYSSGLWVEAIASEGGKNPEKGWKAYLEKVESWRKAVMDSDLITSVQDASAVYAGENQGGDYIAAVYNKGPYALHILRMTFGMEKMNEFLHALMHEFANKEIIARDIQQVAERVYGGVDDNGNRYNADLSWFFDQWIRGIGIPQYSFNYDYRKTEDGNWLVEGNIRQRVLFGQKKKELKDVFFRGVVPITVLGRDRQEYPVRVVVEGETTPFRFKIPVEPEEITLNKYGESLAYDILENRGW